MPKYNHENFGDVMTHIFAKGVITSVDSDNDIADVTVEGYQNGSGVPLFYHCDPDSEERDNGAIEGAAAGFSVDDEVVVMCTADGAPVRIVGFVDGIRDCIWEPWDGPNIDSKHDWIWGSMPGFTAEIVDGVLCLEWSAGVPGEVRWTESETDVGPEVGNLVLKASASGTPSHLHDRIAIWIEDSNGAYRIFYFIMGAGWVPDEINIYLGDNGGAEQTIDLLTYGLSGRVVDVKFSANAFVSAFSLNFDHINFTS